MSKFNNPKNIIKCVQNIGCKHVQCVSHHYLLSLNEYEGMKTDGVTDPPKHFG